MCCRCSATQKKVWVFGCGSFAVLIALIFGLLWPTLSFQLLYRKLVLKEGSLTYNNWIETPIPMYLEIYLFNWDNPEDLQKPNVKPRFTEMGPYVFMEKHARVNLNWNDDNTISFNQTRIWTFDESKSNGSLDDEITSLNVISATVVNLMKDKDEIVKMIANFMLKEKEGSPIIKKTVHEWLFEGFEDPLLTFLKSLHMPGIDIPFDKFGWFAERNGSDKYDGRFTMFTGADDIHKLGKLTEWNGENHTRFYKDECGKVKGTSGELWPADMDPRAPKTVFATDICRFVTLPYNKNVEHYGIDGSEYVGDELVFDNGQIDPKTRCNCPYEETRQCQKSGVLDVSECRYGAPVYVSYPHFYLADESYSNAVQGLNADKAKHQFTMGLEPTTGIPLYVNARLQINIHLKPYKEFEYYKNVPDVMFPMFWFQQSASLDDSLSGQAKLAINLQYIGVYFSYALGALGILIILVGVYLTITKKWTKRTYDDEEILTNNQ